MDLPIVVDFEQGFASPYVSVYWMKELQAAGASAIHIDDYGLPYKCPFIPPHVMGLENMELTAAKIRALVGEKNDPDFMVIGRPGTFVAVVYDSEEGRRADWLRRARSYLADRCRCSLSYLLDSGAGTVVPQRLCQDR